MIVDKHAVICFSKFTLKVYSWRFFFFFLELHADIRVAAWRRRAICFKPVNASYLLQLVTNEVKFSTAIAHFQLAMVVLCAIPAQCF